MAKNSEKVTACSHGHLLHATFPTAKNEKMPLLRRRSKLRRVPASAWQHALTINAHILAMLRRHLCGVGSTFLTSLFRRSRDVMDSYAKTIVLTSLTCRFTTAGPGLRKRCASSSRKFDRPTGPIQAQLTRYISFPSCMLQSISTTHAASSNRVRASLLELGFDALPQCR
jgi:hypothetical protein